jgi:inosine-uridine nucleoside N-ribohydrolase
MRRLVCCFLFLLIGFASNVSCAAEKVVVDLDIGDDIDDAFALALILVSPEFEVVGVSTVWGDTPLRVRLVQRFLDAFGRNEVPVAQGIVTPSTTVFSQARWAERWRRMDRAAPPSVDMILSAASAHPGEVTLLALGPLTNVAAALRSDPVRFRRFKRIVLMGGSVRRGYGRSQYARPSPPTREYNIAADIAAAQAVFASGVPIEVYPLDATIVQLDDVRRRELFAHGSAVTDTLTLLYQQWSGADAPWANPVPTLFDVVPVAALIDPATCPLVTMRIVVGADGTTRETAGAPNATVCLESDRVRVLDVMMRRLLDAP